MMQVISLGWGVQSFALAAMSALGHLPPVDVAIHADAGHEKAATYAFAARWTPWLQDHGLKVVTVHGGKPITGPGAPNFISIPAFTTYDDGRPSGMLRRQCSYDWRIAPIRRWLQKHRNRHVVHQWLGFTLDEIRRARPADVKYVQHRFPFIHDLHPPLDRRMAERWLRDNHLEIPIKSSCVFCPYQDPATWRQLKLENGPDWHKALEVDAAIRHRRPGYIAYLIRARVPLSDYDFPTPKDHGQMTLCTQQQPASDFL